MPQLHVRRSELTYEAVLSPPVGALLDSPGRFIAGFLSAFEKLNVDLSDISVSDEGPIDTYSIACDVDEIEASVELRIDRLEVRCPTSEADEQSAAGAISLAWEMLRSIVAEASPKSESILFELDCEIPAGSYSRFSQDYCPVHKSLPEGTETAVVYYLPADSDQDLLECNLVLNRSASIEDGVLVAATIVFEGGNPNRKGLVQTAQRKLKSWLAGLDIALVGE